MQSLRITARSPVEGSYGGGLAVNITGDGFAETNVSAWICEARCLKVTVVSNRQLICVTPSLNGTGMNRTCPLIVMVDGTSESTSFTYRTDLTATVESISPNRGGTAGGTLVTITGSQFP